MPFRNIPGSATQYALVSFDANGTEHTDDPDGLDGRMTKRILEVASQGFTNIFFFSHGWRGDVPAAIDQYNRWIRAVDTQTANRDRAAKTFLGFRPLYIGLHWPSEPWGDEEIAGAPFATGGGFRTEEVFQSYVDRLGDTPQIRLALRTILDEARQNAMAQSLTDRARQAYLDLNEALRLGSGGPGAPPDADREPFDPDAAFDVCSEEGTSFGPVRNALFGPLRIVSFWTMKKRARTIGEGGMHAFVKDLQRATEMKATRIHLMGHSFGCVIVSSMIGGPEGKTPLERPIDSVILVQGALSLWSCSPEIPFHGVGSGYFHRILHDGKVRGPLVTTRSRHDTAVGWAYPRASWFSREVSFVPGELPKYGAVGSFGLRGLPATIMSDTSMLPANAEYDFAKGHVYNLEGSQFICRKHGPSGAHNDIDGPEVAHALWQAAFASI